MDAKHSWTRHFQSIKIRVSRLISLNRCSYDIINRLNHNNYRLKYWENVEMQIWKYEKKHTHTKTLESHKNQTSTTRHLLQTWKTTKHNQKAWERSNLSGSIALLTTTTFSKLQTPRKMLQEWSKINFHQLQFVWSRKRENSTVSRMISR